MNTCLLNPYKKANKPIGVQLQSARSDRKRPQTEKLVRAEGFNGSTTLRGP
jgi:hypothetical protein